MRARNEFEDFQDDVFQEISDLESEQNKHIITNTLREYGLTLQEAARLYYVRGMSGREFIEAVKTAREK